MTLNKKIENRTAPSNELQNKCIDSLRNLVMIVITISLVWFLSWKKTRTMIEKYRSAVHLNAWLNLKEFAGTLPKRTDTAEKRYLLNHTEPFEEPKWKKRSNTTIVGYKPEAPFNAIKAGTGSTAKRLVINAYWPSPTNIYINLYRHALTSDFDIITDSSLSEFHTRYLIDSTAAEFFDIYTNTPEYHFEDYELMRLYDSTERFVVLQKDRNGHLRWRGSDSLEYLEYDSTLARPKFADNTMPFLFEAGVYQRLDSLSIKDPGVRLFLLSSSIDALNFDVLGISVPLNVSIAFFSIVVALIAFSMLGPYSYLKRRDHNFDPESSWILILADKSEKKVFKLETLLIAISLLFAVLPLFLFILQCISGIFSLFSFWFVFLNFASSVYSTFVFLRVIFLLRNIRKSSTQ